MSDFIDSLGTNIEGYREKVKALSGTAPVINPEDGTIQYWTLTATSSPVDSLESGHSITLMVNSSSYSVTWPTMTWVGGTEPTLEATGYNIIVLWKINTTLYGLYVGAA